MKKLVFLGILTFLLLVVSVSAEILSPSPGDQLATTAGLDVSWTSCGVDSYLVQIATDSSFTDIYFQATAESTTYQIQEKFPPASYYVRAIGINDTAFICETSPVLFIVLENPDFSLSYDDENYAESYLLNFVANGPEQASVYLNITSVDGFYLPVYLDDLSSPQFSSVLPPSIYQIYAKFDFLGTEYIFEDEFTLPFSVQQTYTVTESNEDEQDEESQDDGKLNLSIFIEDIDEDPVSNVEIEIAGNGENETYQTDSDGYLRLKLYPEEYKVEFRKPGYVDQDKTVDLTESKSLYIIMPSTKESAPKKVASESTEQEEDSVDTQEQSLSVLLQDFPSSRYDTRNIPLSFTVKGNPERCQVLTQKEGSLGYGITQTVLSPRSDVQATIDELGEGIYDIKVRCIEKNGDYAFSNTLKLTIQGTNSYESIASSVSVELYQAISEMNSVSQPLDQLFADDLEVLKEKQEEIDTLYGRLQSEPENADDIEDKINDAMRNIESLPKEVVSEKLITQISFVDQRELQAFASVIETGKSPEQLLFQQEYFAVRTSYTLETITYFDNSTKEYTVVTSSIVPINGVPGDISYFSLEIIPEEFFTNLVLLDDQTAIPSGEFVVVDSEESVGLLFSGKLAVTEGVKTIVYTDSLDASNEITGFIVDDLPSTTWKTPLIAFVVIIILAGLFLNPYFSIIGSNKDKNMNKFTSSVHHCLDLVTAKKPQDALELFPKILHHYDKLSQKEQEESKEVYGLVTNLFHETHCSLLMTQIETNAVSTETLDTALGDLYHSYSLLPGDKQQQYLDRFKSVVSKAQSQLEGTSR